MATRLLRAERFFNRFSDWIGRFSAILLLLLVAIVFYNVIMRYLFNDVSIGLQELEWHLYAMVFLFGVAYTLKAGGHVRVDIVYERQHPRTQAAIDILGVLLFLWPFCLLVAFYGVGFAFEAFETGEKSGDPGGLPYRWIIKVMISISFLFVLIGSIGFLLHSLNKLLGPPNPHDQDTGSP
jgi:TRAP-type mannitol/chloroaromatic compound transport system permease small subunit